jgi:hypothetical protein
MRIHIVRSPKNDETKSLLSLHRPQTVDEVKKEEELAKSKSLFSGDRPCNLKHNCNHPMTTAEIRPFEVLDLDARSAQALNTVAMLRLK